MEEALISRATEDVNWNVNRNSTNTSRITIGERVWEGTGLSALTQEARQARPGGRGALPEDGLGELGGRGGSLGREAGVGGEREGEASTATEDSTQEGRPCWADLPKPGAQCHVPPCPVGQAGLGSETFILFSLENKLYIIDLPLKNVCAKFLLPSQRL